MRVMGVDPGTAICGWGMIDSDGDNATLVDYGAVTTEAGTPLAQRLHTVYWQLDELIRRYKPDALAVEQLFFSKNVTTALAVGHARGVVLLAAANEGVAIHEYRPMEVKQAIVGYGKATKDQMQQMVRMILGLDDIPRPDDAADALAIALCHAQSSRYRALLDES
ncbi:MAG: crossover junction endodeoxyribonuclease RuvC [Anaerolineae bacterium]